MESIPMTEQKEKITTIQKANKLNEVYRVGDVGPGGAYHEYFIAHPRGPWLSASRIVFQKGPRLDQNSVSGVLDCDLLEIVRDRLQCFQRGEFSCRENAIALTHIEEALMWMNKRVEDRAERNVLGTYEK